MVNITHMISFVFGSFMSIFEAKQGQNMPNFIGFFEACHH
jgi:hypothetical protein